MNTLTSLPTGLPRPSDDGGADHLTGLFLPSIALGATSGSTVTLSQCQQRTILYVYPMTGRPGHPLPEGWDSIPGARGCTPQACSFRDHHHELALLHTQVFGISTQSSTCQQEAKQRLHLPFELLSDASLQLKQALNLPTFELEGKRLYKRLTMICSLGQIKKVFYPVFPPDRHIDDLLAWLRSHANDDSAA